MPATMISPDEADRVVKEATRVSQSGEPTLRQLRLSRFAKYLETPTAVDGGAPPFEFASSLSHFMANCRGDKDTALVDALANMNGLSVSKVVLPIVVRLADAGYTRFAQITPEVVDDHARGEEIEWLAKHPMDPNAIRDAIAMLVELKSTVSLASP